MSKVSIIIPVYNAEAYIRQCIDSIISQSFVDWELLLIDDGSVDRSLSICQDYALKDDRIKLFHKDNGGVSSARNLGLRNAFGDWIAFVDADDFLERDYLSSLLTLDESDMVIGGYKNEKGVGEKISDAGFTKVLGEIDFMQRKNSRIFYFPWRRLYKKHLIDRYHIFFDEEMRLSEDTCFTVRYMAHCRCISFSPTCNYIYRTGTGTAKYKLNYNEFEEHCSKFKEVISYFQSLTGIKLAILEGEILSIFFYYYKDFLKTVNSYREYAENTKAWNFSNLNLFINNYLIEKPFIKKILYEITILFPLVGYIVRLVK